MATSGDTAYVLADPINGDVVTGEKFFKSVDGGQSWSGLTPPTGFESGGQIASPGANKVYVLYYDYNAGSQVLVGSSDGGNSWTTNNMPASTYLTLAVGDSGKLVSVSSGGAINVIESGDDGQSWSAPVNVGAGDEVDLAADPAGASMAVVWSSGNTIWAAASAGTPPSPSPVEIEILDANGSPVTTLTRNAEGWPSPNPLEVRMTFTNTTSANLSDPLLALEINSPFTPGLENEREGRFYVLDENGFGGGDEFPHIAQYRKVVEPGAMTPGQVKTISATLWVQPSVTTTLDIKAEFYADSWANDLLGEDTALVNVPLAEIHPMVLMPGLLASFPPGPDGLPDPLMQTYDNMLAALKQTGYEPGQGWFNSEYDPQYAGSGATLLAFGYDWRNPLGETGQTAVKDYIDRIINTPAVDQKPYVNYNQVTIVAHSTGGLIARAYIENSEANKHTVNKLITLGAPHEGTLAAYRAWYGGDPTGIIRDIEMFRALLGLFAWCEVNSTQYTDSSIPEIYALMTEDYYNYFRARVPSATDFMPRANYVPAPYLQALPVLPSPLLCGGQNNYDYCYGKPPSNFLDDLNTSGGLFDITRLNDLDLPIISAYSSAFDTDGVYNVSPPSSPPPPSFPLLPKPEFWKYGELANIPQDIVFVDGDLLVPEFSGDLTRIVGYPNILGQSEKNPANDLWHMSLNYDPIMVRRIVSYVTNIPETDIRPSFWNAPYDDARNFWDNVAIASCSPVRLIATDPLGRRAGLDLESGQIINEIPGAFVSEDGVDPQVILLPDVEGQYQVQGLGVEEGDYKIGALLSITQTESVVVVSSQTGTTTIGQDYGFTFDTRIPPVAAFRATPLTGTVPLTVTFSDETAGAADTWLWNYGDGQDEMLMSSANHTHIYTAPGLYTVSLTVNGEYGAHTFTRTGYISVTDVSTPTPTPTSTPTATPTPTATAQPTATPSPSPTTTPLPTFTPTPTATPTSTNTPVATPTPTSTPTATPTHTPAPTFTPTVMPTPTPTGDAVPIVTISSLVAPVDPVQVGTEVSIEASFSDTDPAQSHIAHIDWDDGAITAGVVDETNDTVTGNHAYSVSGVYTLKVTVVNAAGSSSEAVFRYVVIYDPDGGFVTGGGWIDSPPGAYAPDPSLIGKANFGFVSKYKKGTNTPTGNTQFDFKVAGLNFHSASYQWLVVAGPKAQFKGSGTINGSGDYGFMLTAVDGQLNGGGGVDKFRIKIWDKTTEGVVYDNRLGATDDAEPVTAIGSGGIVVHKK